MTPIRRAFLRRLDRDVAVDLVRVERRDVGDDDRHPLVDHAIERGVVMRELEEGKRGSRFPVLMLHSDCDGESSVADCEKLRHELTQIAVVMKERPAIAFTSGWQQDAATRMGLVPTSAFESFISPDGEPLIERLRDLVETARARGLPILFQ